MTAGTLLQQPGTLAEEPSREGGGSRDMAKRVPGPSVVGLEKAKMSRWSQEGSTTLQSPRAWRFLSFSPLVFFCSIGGELGCSSLLFRVPLSKDEVLAGSLGEVSSELPTVAVTDDVGGGSYCCA